MSTSAPVCTEPENESKPGCPKCGSMQPWGLSSWCPVCGYYPKLGICTESDPVQAARALEAVEEDIPIWERIPPWGWVLIVGCVFPIILAIAGRFFTESGSWDRTYWTLGQCSMGGLLFSAMHFWAFLAAAHHNARFSVLDLLMKPVGIWNITFQKLPYTAMRVQFASWGLSMMVSALAITGGIRYSAVFDDWGFRKQTRDTNLIKAITENAKQEGGADNLNDAISDFAGEAKAAAGIEAYKEPPREEADCVIIGLSKTDGEITGLLVAGVVNRKLSYVGEVREGLSSSFLKEIRNRAKGQERSTPSVSCRATGEWLKPVIMCKISYQERNSRGELIGARLEELLKNARVK